MGSDSRQRREYRVSSSVSATPMVSSSLNAWNCLGDLAEVEEAMERYEK